VRPLARFRAQQNLETAPAAPVDVADRAPRRVLRPALRPPCFEIDDLGVDLPFLGTKCFEFGVMVLTSADLIADAGDGAVALHCRDGRALVLLRLALVTCSCNDQRSIRAS
jgi:hypothetical protein